VTTVQLADASAFSAGATPEIVFTVKGHRCAFTMEAPGDQTIPSVFLVGLPKAGSTLLTHLMKPLVQAAGLAFVSAPDVLRRLGVAPKDFPAEINQVFQPQGYAFGGFRSLPGALALPAFAADRTVLLIRDPRDMLTSLYFSVAHSQHPPGPGIGGALAATFEAKRREANDMDIDDFVLSRARGVVVQYGKVERKLRRIPHKLYRYEDVIFDKLGWANDMMAYLDLSPPPGVLKQVVTRNDVRPDVEDMTRHVRKVTPGDHIEKLKPETITELNGQLGPLLQKYGYT
jgi:hypothetical protein